MKKRIISILLALVMVLCLVPTAMACVVPTIVKGDTATNRAYSATRGLLSRQKVTYAWAQGNVNSNDWCVFGLARDGVSIPQSYIDSVKEFTPASNTSVSDCARAILTLTACGEEVSDALLDGVTAKDNFMSCGDVIFALLALDSRNYTVPDGGMSRDKLKTLLLGLQQDNGAWGSASYSGSEWVQPYWGPDVDTTAQAITALAPYCSDANVKTAVDNALEWLKAQQITEGEHINAFGGWGSASVESTAQVIVALTALGIDPTTWNERDAVKGMCTLAIPAGGFFNYNNEYDEYTTSNGYYALVAYKRFNENKNALYDMTDANSTGDVTLLLDFISQLFRICC